MLGVCTHVNKYLDLKYKYKYKHPSLKYKYKYLKHVLEYKYQVHISPQNCRSGIMSLIAHRLSSWNQSKNELSIYF